MFSVSDLKTVVCSEEYEQIYDFTIDRLMSCKTTPDDCVVFKVRQQFLSRDYEANITTTHSLNTVNTVSDVGDVMHHPHLNTRSRNQCHIKVPISPYLNDVMFDIHSPFNIKMKLDRIIEDPTGKTYLPVCSPHTFYTLIFEFPLDDIPTTFDYYYSAIMLPHTKRLELARSDAYTDTHVYSNGIIRHV